VIKFADEVVIEVASGKGGNGCVGFRREKYVPKGGPAGGDGGRGGDLIFEVKRNLRTLAHLRYLKRYAAQGGQDGMGKNCHGKDGEDMIVPVPPGTLIKDPETGEILKDFSADHGSWVFLKGGNGGWGNTHFKSSTNQTPMIALPGKPAQSVKLRIELNIMADIGLVGFPNAGKSSLLDAFTNARPKIAPYPFTTKIPNLGVLTMNDRDVIIADIPGIIEGAHDGAGLGIRFLKHIARTSALAFLIDCSEENASGAFPILLSELASFSADLASKPRIVIGTKLDLEGAAERLEEIRAGLAGERVLGMSVFSLEGLPEVKKAFFDFVIQAEEREKLEKASAIPSFGRGAPDDPDGFGQDPEGCGGDARP
jgi:GTPase